MACTPFTWDSAQHTLDVTLLTFDQTEICTGVVLLPAGEPTFSKWDVQLVAKKRKRPDYAWLLLG